MVEIIWEPAAVSQAGHCKMGTDLEWILCWVRADLWPAGRAFVETWGMPGTRAHGLETRLRILEPLTEATYLGGSGHVRGPRRGRGSRVHSRFSRGQMLWLQ